MEERYHERYRFEQGSGRELSALDSGLAPPIGGKAARRGLIIERRRLSELQEKLYAEGRRSLLLVLQAMDGGGKDATIRRVFSGINPQGCHVTSFKKPSGEELAHDFLWRVHRRAPARGYIGVFNRSHYEDVLVPRVYGMLPPALLEARYEHINCFESLLEDSGTRIVKVFLHISKEYQLMRMRRRAKRADRNWKFTPEDLVERERWEGYMEAYDALLQRCSTQRNPWYAVPAHHRSFAGLVVAQLLADTLAAMNPRYPPPAWNPQNPPPKLA
jgi:PPK2 family polyphosphate:nucleotide phosphotransferase